VPAGIILIIGYTLYIIGNGKVVIWYRAYTVGNIVDMKCYHKFNLYLVHIYIFEDIQAVGLISGLRMQRQNMLFTLSVTLYVPR